MECVGYFLPRASHLELYVKIPKAKEAFQYERTGNLSGFGQIYLQDPSLSYESSLHFNNSCLVSDDVPNMTFLRCVNIDLGVKVYFRGVFSKEEIDLFQENFGHNATRIINKMLKLKKENPKINRSEIIDKIRCHLIRDKLGYAHGWKCTCEFSDNLDCSLICDDCLSYSVKNTRPLSNHDPFQELSN